MPIQVVSTYKKIPQLAITLVSAGDDIFPVCDISITLTVSLDPIENLQGHTILWEQLSGTPVVINNDDQVSANYLQLLLDETDKEFRVTLDAGSPIAQSDTVIVYATPTSITSTNFARADVRAFTPALPVEESSFVATTSGIVPPPGGVIDPDVPVAPSFLISWDIPSDPLLLPFLTTMTLFENGIQVGVFTSTDTLEYQGGQNMYNVVTDYIVNGHASSVDSVIVDYTNETIPNTNVVDDSIQTSSFAGAQVVIQSLTNTVNSVEDITSTSFPSSDFKVARLINILNSAAEAQPAGFANGTSIITRTDPGGIGGG